jgi:UDP-2,4-diacetamido-2,4,6-trideoxy-beta-L-altropyranose hydrolase
MAMRNIVFRVDASSQIGTGHFMRCLTLADVFKQRGALIRFVSRHLPEHLRGMLRERGYEFIWLNSESVDEEIDELTHSCWLGVSQQFDAKNTIHALSDRAWDWIIVDHYALDARWENALRGSTSHIFVIDDLADRVHDCDILLDDNLFPDIETRYINKVPTYCRLLLGPSYVPLRDEFLQLREKAKLRTGTVNRVLVSFGGIDADNYTSWAIEALINSWVRDLAIDVVLGAQNSNRKQIQNDCDRYSLNCYVQTNQMANLMSDADLAIGAAGYTSYEFAAMKLPAILIPVSDIQTIFAKEMENKGVACVAKVNKSATTEEVTAAFLEVIDSVTLRSSMSRACVEVIDGKGMVRIIDELLSFEGAYEF